VLEGNTVGLQAPLSAPNIWLPYLCAEAQGPALKTGRGILAKYGQAPSAEDIDANRAEMFQDFATDF
jgi:hypothetical protein